MRRADLLVAVLLTASAALFFLLLLAFSGHLVRVPGEPEPAAAPQLEQPPPPIQEPAPAPVQPAAPAESDPILDVRPPPAPPAPAEAPSRPSAAPAAAPVPVVVRAPGGDCWLQARAGSETGRLLYEGTLEQGKSIRFAVKRLWLRLGAASHVVVTVGGKRRPAGTGTVDLLI